MLPTPMAYTFGESDRVKEEEVEADDLMLEDLPKQPIIIGSIHIPRQR